MDEALSAQGAHRGQGVFWTTRGLWFRRFLFHYDMPSLEVHVSPQHLSGHKTFPTNTHLNQGPAINDFYKKYVGPVRGGDIEARGDPILGGSLVLDLNGLPSSAVWRAKTWSQYFCWFWQNFLQYSQLYKTECIFFT